MVEVIWPLSMVPCKAESTAGRGVLPLRTYIEETLRRSRTSYSTLQVALYYLVLIKPFVPPQRRANEHNTDCPAGRALMCGRRMFLAALILASKYLQDRNYSAKAWSKMSGLRVCEINANERIFLSKINWKLHVAKPLFDRWTEIVLRYTPSAYPPPSPPGDAIAIGVSCWKTLVPVLTPDLDDIPLPERVSRPLSPDVSPCDFVPSATPTPTKEICTGMQIDSDPQDTTPTPATVCPPRFLEPQPTLLPPTPALTRLGPLPTPQMTPSSVASSTPAVSACSSRRPSICAAMSLAQRCGVSRCANDEYPFPTLDKYRSGSRRPSVTSSASTRSSPESLISDRSRSSRASSISSVATVSTTSSCLAPHRTNLARMATTRNVRLPLPPIDVMDEGKDMPGSAARPIGIAEDEDPIASEATLPDFSINEKKLSTPHRHSKHALRHHHPVSSNPAAAAAEKGRKRHRCSRGSRRSDFYDEIRSQLEDQELRQEDDDAMVIDLIDSDPDSVAPSPAVARASDLLRRFDDDAAVAACSPPAKQSQPPAALSRRLEARLPLQKLDGSKRACCSSSQYAPPGQHRSDSEQASSSDCRSSSAFAPQGDYAPLRNYDGSRGVSLYMRVA